MLLHQIPQAFCMNTSHRSAVAPRAASAGGVAVVGPDAAILEEPTAAAARLL